MKFIGGTAAARKLFEDLVSDGLLCMPYTDQWMKANAEKLDEDYEHFLTSGKNYRNDEGVVFIDASQLNSKRLRELIKVFPAFGGVFREESTMTNPDFIVINLKTQKMILFGLGRRDQIHVHIYVDGEFQPVLPSTYDDYINQSFETDDDTDIAVDPTFHYLQDLCDDFFEIIDNTYTALEAFGIASFEYMSLPANRYEIESLLDEEPNADGMYELDGDEMSEDDLREILDDYERLGDKCAENLAYLQVLFPKVEHSELATGAY